MHNSSGIGKTDNMRKCSLMIGEKESLEKAYRSAHHRTERERYLALKLLSQGYLRKEVASILDRSLSVIGNWVTLYNHQGVEGLREKRKTGNHRHLTWEQKDRLARLMKEKTPEQYGYGGRFWTVALLQELVQREYGIIYRSDQSYRDLFRYAGFSFHKPAKVHQDQNPHMRRRFEQKLKKNSQNTGEKIVWYW